jgi:hypothetical protein
MRVLGATGILNAVAEDIYAHTRFSLAYINGMEVDFFTLWYVFVLVILFLQKHCTT